MVKKVFKIIAIVVAALLALAMVAVNVLFARYDEMDTVEKIAAKGVPYEHAFVDYNGYRINAWCFGDRDNEKALLIHGSPGHWVDWVELYTDTSLLKDYCLITFDRPGYGGTTMPADGALQVQARVAAAVMEHFCGTDVCYSVAGHSYGGGVVEEVLIDYPEQVNAGIYVAGTLSPDDQPKRWYNYIAAFPPVQWVIPNAFVSSNIEMMVLAEELRQNEGLQKSITTPITLIQGTADVLVPYETAEYYRSVKPTGVKYIIVEGMNHFIPWTDPEIVIKAIKEH